MVSQDQNNVLELCNVDEVKCDVLFNYHFNSKCGKIIVSDSASVGCNNSQGIDVIIKMCL